MKLFFILGTILFFRISVCAQNLEEFNGPFPSWANVKSRFGAKGDGKTDDTKALQKALDNLSVSTLKFNTGKDGYTVVYLPAGHYVISETLRLRGKIGISIIGEDPGKTVLEWTGKAMDTMFWSNGSAYFKVSRIQFNGQNIKGVRGLGIHWTQKWKEQQTRSYASLNIEVSDCLFNGLSFGITGGYHWNDSEVKISRCVFNACDSAGIQIKGHNALDYWIWYCKFLNCNVGVNVQKGNYHIYNSYFKSSGFADLYNYHGYYTSVRGCFSEGSKAFSIDYSSSSNSFKRIFQDNIIKEVQDLPIVYHHIGKPTFYGNSFDKIADEKVELKAVSGKKKKAAALNRTPATISYQSWAKSNFDILSIDNAYYYENPFRKGNGNPGTVYSINDRHGERVKQTSDEFLSKLPTVPGNQRRKIFEVPVGADAGAIQKIINDASALKGQRPIVHFPFGVYKIDRTIEIPREADLQIIGDGYRYSTTILPIRENFAGKSVFKIMGPSYISMSELQIGGPGRFNLNAFEFDNIDQQKARLFIDQLYSKADASLYLDGLDYLYVQKDNSFFTDGNILIGGVNQKNGSGTFKVNSFGGQYKGVTLKNNASFLSKDCWWEGPDKFPVDLTGDGTLTIDGSKIAPAKSDTSAVIKINSFKGRVSILNAYIQGGLRISHDNPSLSFLLWNANIWHNRNIFKSIPGSFNGKLAFMGITSQCFDKNDPECKQTRSFDDVFVNIKDKNNFLLDLTKQTRTEQPKVYSKLDNGISNIFLSRVVCEGFENSILVIAK